MTASIDYMIKELNPKEIQSVKQYIEFLIYQRPVKEPRNKKIEALQNLQKHRGLLNGEDRDALMNEAMEEKYGHIS